MRWILFLLLAVMPLDALAYGVGFGNTTRRKKRWDISCHGVQGPKQWDRLKRPIIIAHRGAGNVVAPDNTMPAFEWAAAQGCIVECDLQYTKDDHLVCHHDTTIDRMTGRTDGLTTRDFTLVELRAMDFSQGHIPALFSPQPITTFAEYMALAEQGALLAPEVRGSTGSMGTDVATRIVAAGLQESFLVQAFAAVELLAVKAVDPTIRTMALGSNVTVETAVTNGYWAVSPERSAFIALPNRSAWQAEMQAAGVRVIPYVSNKLDTTEELRGLGVNGFFTDRPAHVVRAGQRVPRGTTTIAVPPVYDLATWPWSSQIPGVNPVVSAGFATLAGYSEWGDGASIKIEVAGVRTADVPATQTISTTLKVTAPSPSGSISRFIALRWAWQDEGLGASSAGKGGYQFAYRLDGGVTLRRFEPASILLESGSWPAISVGEEIPIRIDMTDTSITVTRTDTEHTITAEDDTLPRGGFIHVFAGGLIPAIGDVTITY